MNLFKKPLVVLFVLALGTLSSGAFAQGAKVGFVDFTKVVKNSPLWKKTKSKLEKEFKGRDASLKKKVLTIKKLEDELRKQNRFWSKDQIRAREVRIRKLKIRLKREQAYFREDLTLRQNEELRKLEKKVYAAILKIAEKEKYDLILHKRAVVYASKKVEITDKIIKMLK
jgi:outer membrane protein